MSSSPTMPFSATAAYGPGDEAMVRQRAGELYDAGHNCSEVLVRVHTEMGLITAEDADTMEIVSTGFGKGMGKTLGNCGALVGAAMVINLLFGRRLKKRKWIYKISGEFSQLFLNRFDSLACHQLRNRKDLNCRDLTCETAVMLSQFLAKRLPAES